MLTKEFPLALRQTRNTKCLVQWILYSGSIVCLTKLLLLELKSEIEETNLMLEKVFACSQPPCLLSTPRVVTLRTVYAALVIGLPVFFLISAAIVHFLCHWQPVGPSRKERTRVKLVEPRVSCEKDSGADGIRVEPLEILPEQADRSAGDDMIEIGGDETLVRLHRPFSLVLTESQSSDVHRTRCRRFHAYRGLDPPSTVFQ